MATRRIEPLVRDLLVNAKTKRPPIPVDVIAQRIGAVIRYAPFEGEISGMVFRDEERKIIGVNSLHHPNRQRFTIAHEIGHILLHKGEEFHVDRTFRINLRDDVSSKAVDPDEIEANCFAAELLMPHHMLVADLKGQEIDFENEKDLRQIAREYGVSLQALSFRLMNLGLIRPA